MTPFRPYASKKRQSAAGRGDREAGAAPPRRRLTHPASRGRSLFACGLPPCSSRPPAPPPPRKEGRWLGAILACGEGAVLSHRSAAALWGVLPIPSGAIDVTVPSCSERRKRRGIALHRSATLSPACFTCHRGIPVTTPARTIADLRRIMSAARVEAAVRQARILRLDIGEHLTAESDLTRSELERRFLRLCRRRRLPLPEVNVRVDRFEVDFLWRDQRLIVEMDGYRFHADRSSFEDDRARDAALKVMGYDVLRFTYRQLTSEPKVVAATVRALLVGG